jgi:hypothetical protein
MIGDYENEPDVAYSPYRPPSNSTPRKKSMKLHKNTII